MIDFYHEFTASLIKSTQLLSKKKKKELDEDDDEIIF